MRHNNIIDTRVSSGPKQDHTISNAASAKELNGNNDRHDEDIQNLEQYYRCCTDCSVSCFDQRLSAAAVVATATLLAAAVIVIIFFRCCTEGEE